ncbi:MAG TPA: hypothetical protein VI039_09025 [Solirubrobacterales bacterium]
MLAQGLIQNLSEGPLPAHLVTALEDPRYGRGNEIGAAALDQRPQACRDLFTLMRESVGT